MSNEDKKNLGDDEYQFPSEEYIFGDEDADTQASDTKALPYDESDEDDEDGVPAAKPSLTERFPILKNKRVLLVVGVAVVALVGFTLMSGNKTKVVQAPQVTAQPQQIVQPQVSDQPSPQVMGELSGLQKAAQQSDATVNSLQAQVSDLQQKVEVANNSNQKLASALESLTAQMQVMNQKLEKLNEPKPVQKKTAKPVRRISYTLKAIVPGRAWIKSSTGQSQTVRMGDRLPQYGTVINVNPDQGVVLTSSGKVIGYGANDS